MIESVSNQVIVFTFKDLDSAIEGRPLRGAKLRRYMGGFSAPHDAPGIYSSRDSDQTVNACRLDTIRVSSGISATTMVHQIT